MPAPVVILALPRVAMLTLCALWTLCTASCGTESPVAASGCSDDQIDKSAVVQVTDSSGKAVTGTFEFDVSTMGSGTKKELQFAIANPAPTLTARALTIKSVKVVETDNSDKPLADQAFSCVGPEGKACAEATWPPLIPSGFAAACAPSGAKTTTSFVVRYQRMGSPDVRRLKIALVFGGDSKQGDTPYLMTMATRLGTPKLECTPPVTDFGKVGLAEGATGTVSCANTGKADAQIFGAKMLGSLPLTAQLGNYAVSAVAPLPDGKTITVAAGQALEIPVSFGKLTTEAKSQAILRFNTNDQAKPEVNLYFNVNTSGPCLTLEPNKQLDFLIQPVGVPVAKELKLKSCGTEDLQISALTIAEGAEQGFGIDFGTTCFGGKAPSDASPLVIPKGSLCTVNVSYAAPKLGATNKGTLLVKSTAGEATLPLAGQAPTSVQCPKACMTVKLANGGSLAGEVIPQSQLKLDASCATATSTGTPITKYKWSVQQPLGSYAVLSPSDAVKTVSFQPNIAGKYTFSLEIADSLGTPGCSASTYELNVISDDKIHVELIWDTPSDPNKTDIGNDLGKLPDGKYAGTDMDLHFAHPLALDDPAQKDLDGNGEPDPWYSACYDCNLFNPLTQWGDISSYDDDAILELDDKDGWGPENIGLHVPEAGKVYHIGAAYLSAWTFGKSTPTVRIYLDGKLAATKIGPAMDEKDLWCAATVSWSPNAIDKCKGADSAGHLLKKKYPNPTGIKCKK